MPRAVRLDLNLPLCGTEPLTRKNGLSEHLEKKLLGSHFKISPLSKVVWLRSREKRKQFMGCLDLPKLS